MIFHWFKILRAKIKKFFCEMTNTDRVFLLISALIYPYYFSGGDPNEFKFMANMDELNVNPCTQFYNFTCGKIHTSGSEANFKNYSMEVLEQRMEIEKVLLNQLDLPGLNATTARNIYFRCQFSARHPGPDKMYKRNTFLKKVFTDMGQYYNFHTFFLNEDFDWIYAVHKMRELGLNFRFLFGLYVNPRSETDRRNILEIRQPFLENDKFKFIPDHRMLVPLLGSSQMENLTIVKAGKFIESLKNVFPMERYIRGFLPDDVAFSLDDEIRVDEGYIKHILDALPYVSYIDLGNMLTTKIAEEIDSLLIFDNEKNNIKCSDLVLKYDHDFATAVAKHHLPEDTKTFVANFTRTMLETTKSLIKKSANFDEKSATKTIQKLSDLQILIGYSNFTAGTPDLVWSNWSYVSDKEIHIDIHNYLENVLKLSKYYMDFQFRQINLINDVREWGTSFAPSVQNAGYDYMSNRIHLPAALLKLRMYGLHSPSYVHYGSLGILFGHELGHVIDASMWHSRDLKNMSINNNYASFEIVENKDCLRRHFWDLTKGYQEHGHEDFADLMAYKLAYYSFLQSDKMAANDEPLPKFKYSARQMFWIVSASKWCCEEAFESKKKEDFHSPNYLRVLMPLSNLPEFARDFKCPIGSPMDPDIKCNFL